MKRKIYRFEIFPRIYILFAQIHSVNGVRENL